MRMALSCARNIALSLIDPKSEMFKRFRLRRALLIFLLTVMASVNQTNAMKHYSKILFSILVAAMCTVSFAADKPNCNKTGKNRPMNKGKACNCGK